MFLDVQRETPVFQCVPVASCPVWASLEKVRVYLCIVSADIYIYIDDFPLPCSYSGRALSVALAVLDRGDALVQHLCFSFQHVHGCLVVGSPALGATLHSCLSSTEEKDSLTSLKPLAMLSLMQPRVPFLVFAVKAQGWSMFNLVSFRMPRSFSVELLSSWVAPNYTDVWDSSSPSAGLHNSPCWIPWHSCPPSFPPRWAFSSCQHDPLATQVFPLRFAEGTLFLIIQTINDNGKEYQTQIWCFLYTLNH